jgi:hypothetical protein
MIIGGILARTGGRTPRRLLAGLAAKGVIERDARGRSMRAA